MQVFTIGVYGKTEDEFFGQLIDNKIDVFVDVRQRRGVRGSLYKFVNKNRLIARLEDLKILYFYADAYVPTKELREIQKQHDKDDKVLKRERTQMSEEFVKEFMKAIIEPNPVENLIEEIIELSGISAPRFCLFCVEAEPEACHRSIVAGEVARKMKTDVCHL